MTSLPHCGHARWLNEPKPEGRAEIDCRRQPRSGERVGMTLSSIVGEVALPALGAGMDMPAHGRRAAMSKRPDGATPRPVPHGMFAQEVGQKAAQRPDDGGGCHVTNSRAPRRCSLHRPCRRRTELAARSRHPWGVSPSVKHAGRVHSGPLHLATACR